MMIKKKRITIAAAPELIKQAETALIKLGFESKSNFAESQLISRNTVTNFFQGKSIQIDSLKRICEALKLNWQDFVTTEQPVEISSHYCCTSKTNQEEITMQTLNREITVMDSETKITKVVITLEGDINSVDKIEFLQAILRQYSGDTIIITDVKSGSIKLFIEGSQEDIEKLVNFIQGKILTELNGFPIQSIEMLDTDENRDNQRNNIVSLSGKFDKRNFPVGWDVPRNFLNQKSLQREQNLAFQRRSRDNEENEIGKVINISQINIPLLLKIKKEETEATKDHGLYSLTLQVCTTNTDDQLPANLKILVFYEASEEMIDEKIARRKTLRSSFLIESQVPFYIEVKLGEETIEKGLYVL
ncbi:helix-turn-helix domain-containing protein [Anabaena aphanizomenioides LEGE 00250]|uniref:Helix-turn-helix domain-containing protein n=1 Tax=Sphaerospermopsis aphanizomenoides LEGE 00250 TaxID=2777972 RepID=A0ABR9VDM5_9CYAN|nr:helix-turn-helix domain-containing protein [Sphaerospermopsis aphanizomenoides]MBE9236587.1 helix-turn-helix domain-containing protein [Sphaerospermopsis aphanizomenoides LEGE 00250]